MPAPRDELLTVDEVLVELGGVSRRTFFRWRELGRAPQCVKLPNGELRAWRADLHTWLKRWQSAPRDNSGRCQWQTSTMPIKTCPQGDTPQHRRTTMITQELVDADTISLPTLLNVTQAAKVLGIGRTLAYELVRTDVWPTPVIRAGSLIKIAPARAANTYDLTAPVSCHTKGASQ